MRVRATLPGYYCNVRIEPGEIFDLLKGPDGKDPIREDWVPELDAKGVDTGKGKYVPYKDPHTGDHVHRDYAPDSGDFLMKDGPKRGEVSRLGWMEEVDEGVPVTIDLSEFQFGFDPDTRKLRRSAPKPAAPARAAKPLRRAG